MKTFYKVPLYRVIYGEGVGITRVDDVIVQKGFCGVKEILTEYAKIDVVPKEALKGSQLERKYRKPSREKEEGAHLLVFEESLCARNHARPEDIDPYVSHYQTSPWKRLYTEMNILSEKDKAKLNQKVQNVMGTKR